MVDLDNTYGYASSFLSESFSRLGKEFGGKRVLSNLEIVSQEDPSLIIFIESILVKYN